MPPGVLELYGRLVVRWRGGLLGFDTFHKEEDERYDFFLLHRPAPDARATIIKQWSVPSDDINFSAAGGRTPVWGALAYAPDTETATVTLTGLRSAHEYRVDVSGYISGPR